MIKRCIPLGALSALVLLAAALPAQPPADRARVEAVGEKPKVADRIDFEFSIVPHDPFSKLNQADPPAGAFRRGETVLLTIKGIPRPGFYTYPLSERTPAQLPDQLSRLNLRDVPGLQPIYPVRESPTELYDTTFDVLLRHTKPFTWVQEILILPDASPGVITLPFSIEIQVCDKHSCLPGTLQFQASIPVSDQPPVELTESLKKQMEVKPEIKVVPLPPELAAKYSEDAAPEKAATNPGPGKATSDGSAAPGGPRVNVSLIAFVLTGVFWGAVSLITPCVFPMIPITVSFFLKQSEKEHHQPFKMALVYCATIITVLTVAAVGLLSFFQELSVNPVMNFAIGGLFIFFALSLFGMYEIELPSSVARFTSSREGQGGLAGTIFMALTFTVISFACVAPFLGGFGGTAATHRFSLFERILGGLAFSITFASPFFLLAVFPTMLKKLPKSGSWLNSVKVVMGFLELAAAVKFLRAGELIFLPETVIFTYDFCLGLYVAISLLCGLYLLDVYRLPHDTPSEHVGVSRLLLSMGFLALAVHLAPGLIMDSATGQNQQPRGIIFAWLNSFLLPDDPKTPVHAQGQGGQGGPNGQALTWSADLKGSLEAARQANRLVFIDFTGKTCQNCRLNERDVFPRPAVRDLLAQYQLVKLYTDSVPLDLYPASERAELTSSTARQRADAAANRQLQADRFDDLRLPLYVIVKPLPNGDFQEVARYDAGLINSEADFIRFLATPLESVASGE